MQKKIYKYEFLNKKMYIILNCGGSFHQKKLWNQLFISLQDILLANNHILAKKNSVFTKKFH